ncbi:reverse transcriptase domain-containing protein [Tanacetum coccineum]
MEEMFYKFIDEGKREHKEMRAFICDFQTTNKILFKERNNSLIELRFGVQELLKVINNTPTIDCEVKGVTTRGGKTTTQDAQNNDDIVHTEEPHTINQDKPVESDEVLTNDQPYKASKPFAQPSNKTQMPLIPFPRRLRNEKEEAQQKKFLENLKQLQINLPFIEALTQMLKYTKFLKGLLTNKARLEEACTITINERCSAVLLNKLPSKEKDPRSFTIPCDIQTVIAFGLHPYHFTYPERKLAMEEMLYKLIDEGKRKHEEMRAFICDFQTTNEILFKERNNSLIELRFGVQELLKVINNTPMIDCEVKGVTTRGGKTTTQDAQNNDDSVHTEEPHTINQDKPVESVEVLTNDQPQKARKRRGSAEEVLRKPEAALHKSAFHRAVLLNKLPSKEKDPGSFTIPCDIGQLHINNALADLGASISLMPYTMYENLRLVDKFILPIDFVILDMPEDSRVTIILGRPFLATAQAMIDVFYKKITLRVGDDEVIFDVDQSIKRPPTKDDECYGIDDLDDTINVEAQELLANEEPDSSEEPIRRITSISTSYPVVQETTKPVEVEREHLYSASANEIDEKKPELKDFPNHLEYAYLHGAIAWKMSNIKGISPSYCTQKILIEDDFKPFIPPQRRLNPKVQDVVKNEIVKLLDSGLIYSISDSSWDGEILPNSNRTRRSRKDNIHLSLWDFCLPKNAFWVMQRFSYFFQRRMIAIFHDMVEDFMEVFKDLLGVWAGIEVDRAKIDVIAKLPYPTNVKGVRRQRIDGKFKPIYYASKTLNNAQEHYTTTEKELLAVVFSFDKFRPYLVLSKTIVYTDHSALKYLFSKQDAKPRLIRLKNLEMSTFTEEEIADEFPDEHLMALKWRSITTNHGKNYFWDEPYAFKLCSNNIMRRCVVGNEIFDILAHCHSGPTGGHHSASVTGRNVYESGFFWLTIFKDAKDYVMRNDACQRSRNISSRSEMPQNNI